MENQATGGAATFGRWNSIQSARLKPLRSHGRVAQAAADNCTAGWPDAGSWEQQAQQEGRWIDGDPMTRRQDGELQEREIKRLVRSELERLIQPVEKLTIRPNRETGEVIGSFRSRGTAFRYSIKDGVVKYGPAALLGRVDGVDPTWTPARADGYREVMDSQPRTSRLDRAEHRLEAVETRMDAAEPRMDARVGDAALAVVQQLAAVSRAWPKMGPRARLLAQEATRLASMALRQAGVDQLAAYGEAV